MISNLCSKQTTHLTFFHSENYIFGKFDAFCKRLEKINDMLNTMETFAGVNNIKIEVCFIGMFFDIHCTLAGSCSSHVIIITNWTKESEISYSYGIRFSYI